MQLPTNLFKAVLLTSIGIVIVFIAATFMSKEAKGDEFFDVKDLSITYMNYVSSGSEPLITNNGLPNRGLDKHLSLNINTNMMDVMYFKGHIHSDTDYDTATLEKGQFRSIGLETELGIRLTNTLDFFVYHHSQHVLDTVYVDHFPVKDAIGIRINLIKKRKDDSVF